MPNREIELKFPVSNKFVHDFVKGHSDTAPTMQKNHYFSSDQPKVSLRTRATLYLHQVSGLDWNPEAWVDVHTGISYFEDCLDIELIGKKGADPINGTDRIEYSYLMSDDVGSIEDLDKLVIDILGHSVFANWARIRYHVQKYCHVLEHEFPVYLDINSGYGPILEIEGPSEEDILSFAKDSFGLTYYLTSENLKDFTSEYVRNWSYYYESFLDDKREILEARLSLDKELLENNLNNYGE
jgi:hypothetical protein